MAYMPKPTKKQFFKLLHKAISPTAKATTEKQELRHPADYTEKQTHQDKIEDTSEKQNDKSREHSS